MEGGAETSLTLQALIRWTYKHSFTAASPARKAVVAGRIQFEAAKRLFEHILSKTTRYHEDRYNALANLGYAEIGLGQYGEAIAHLEEAVRTGDANQIGPWHHAALSFAFFKQAGGDRSLPAQEKSRAHLATAKSHQWYDYNRDFFKRLYPEIADQL